MYGVQVQVSVLMSFSSSAFWGFGSNIPLHSEMEFHMRLLTIISRGYYGLQILKLHFFQWEKFPRTAGKLNQIPLYSSTPPLFVYMLKVFPLVF